MKKLASENSRTSLLKWFLAIAFVCCSLCVPVHTQNFKQQAIKTELVIFRTATDLKATVSYSLLPVKRFKPVTFYRPVNSRAFGNKEQVRFNCIAKQFHQFKSPAHFILSKIIPQDAEEEATSFII